MNNDSLHLPELSQAQRERLAYVEVKAYFCGDLTRADIEKRFGIKPAASARDLATYRRLAPANLAYYAGARRYATTAQFAPLFDHSAERVLSWIKSGHGDGLDLRLRRPVPCESASDLVNPDLGVLSTLTRAIAGRRMVEVEYVSLSSGTSTKILAPLALADTGLRWHLRAFDRDKGRFADFVLTRITAARPIEEPIAEGEGLDGDIQWARVVHLELVPHPGVGHPAAIEADYGMRAGSLELDLRAPLVGYALRRWAVDCTEDHRLDPKSHHLWLRNRQTLYGVESATLAPGMGEGGSVGTV